MLGVESNETMITMGGGVTLTNVKVFITTWNMGNAEARGIEHIFSQKNVTKEYDLVVVGLQESTYTTKNDGSPVDCIAQLTEQLCTCFGDNFYMVEHAQRAQLQLFVFAKRSLKSFISNVEFSIENTGFLHVFPNKGGLLISLSVGGTKLAFISCHLTAHEGVNHCEQRNASIVEILEGVRTGDPRFDVTHQFHHVFWMGDMNYRLTFSPETPSNTKKNIALLNSAMSNKDKHNNTTTTSTTVTTTDDITVDLQPTNDNSNKDIVEGLGDDDSDESDVEVDVDQQQVPSANLTKKQAKKELHKRQRQQVLDLIKGQKWKEMLAFDELNRELSAHRVLDSFTALQPAFWPTFKRSRDMKIPNSVDNNVLNSLSDYYNDKRIPSFTDRILYTSSKVFAHSCTSLFFDACEDAISSDHKPVRAGFQLQVTHERSDLFVDKLLVNQKPTNSRTLPSSTTSSTPLVLRLKVYDLKGFNLEEMDSQMFGGGSDPYIILTTQPPTLLLHKGKVVPRDNTASNLGVKSSVIVHELNPQWKDTMHMQLASMDVVGLSRYASILLSVWDEDQTNADDLIGVCTLSMKDIVHALLTEQQPFFSFDEVLKSNCEAMGRVQGKIALDDVLADVLQDAHIVSTARHIHSNNNHGSVAVNGSQSIDPLMLARIQTLAVVESEVIAHNQSANCCNIV